MKPTGKKSPGARGVPQPFNRQAGHTPQIKPGVARPKTAVSAQSVKRPAAPAAFRPAATPKAVQPKTASGAFNRKPPAAPPVYRPQQTPKVLQAKSAAPASARPHPVAPPVYRPQSKKTVQPKAVVHAPRQTAAPTQPQTPTKTPAPYRPQAKPSIPATQTVQMKAQAFAVQCKLVAAEAARLPDSRVTSPTRSHVTNVIQRSSESDEDFEMDTDTSSSDNSHSDDEEILLATSPHVGDWRRGVADGYREGWDDGIEDERTQLVVQPTFVQALAMVGGPSMVAIGLAQVVPLGTRVVPGQEEDDGNFHGRGLGYQAGAAAAFRILGWARGHYPAIPAGSRLVALAQNGNTCVYCNAAPSTDVDHVYPIQKHWVTLGYQGAPLAQVNDASNLVGSCQPCNTSKSNHYLNNWHGHNWAHGQWFPHGPHGVIPLRRGGAIGLGGW